MTDTKLKTLIKEEIAATLKEDFGSPITDSETAKEELQTAMLDAGLNYLRKRMRRPAGGWRSNSPKIHRAYMELEDLLVDAMMNYNVPAATDENGY